MAGLGVLAGTMGMKLQWQQGCYYTTAAVPGDMW